MSPPRLSLQPAPQPQPAPQTFCLSLTCRNYQQNPRSDSFNDRRGAATICNMEPDLKYTLLCLSSAPETYFPFVWMNSSAWQDLPPQCLPFSKGLLSSSPGNILLCVTEVFKPQVDHLSKQVMHEGDIQKRNLNRKIQEKPSRGFAKVPGNQAGN